MVWENENKPCDNVELRKLLSSIWLSLCLYFNQRERQSKIMCFQKKKKKSMLTKCWRTSFTERNIINRNSCILPLGFHHRPKDDLQNLTANQQKMVFTSAIDEGGKRKLPPSKILQSCLYGFY